MFLNFATDGVNQVWPRMQKALRPQCAKTENGQGRDLNVGNQDFDLCIRTGSQQFLCAAAHARADQRIC